MYFISRTESKKLLSLDFFKEVTAKISKHSFTEPVIYLEISEDESIIVLEQVERLFQIISLPFMVKTPSTLTVPEKIRKFYPLSTRQYPFAWFRSNGYHSRDFVNGQLCGHLLAEHLADSLENSPESLAADIREMKMINQSHKNNEWLANDGFFTGIMMDIIEHLTIKPIEDVPKWYVESFHKIKYVVSNTKQELSANKSNRLFSHALVSLAGLLSNREQLLLLPIFKHHITVNHIDLSELHLEDLKEFEFIHTIANSVEQHKQYEISAIVYHKIVVWAKQFINQPLLNQQVKALIEKSTALDPETQFTLCSIMASPRLYQHKKLLVN